MTDWKLQESDAFGGLPGPVVVCVMDGVGCGAHDEGDAVWLAKTPTLDRLAAMPLCTQLTAHGTAVGMPSDADMGNSEVGHNAIGAGRTFDQGAKLVDEAIREGRMFAGETWKSVVGSAQKHGGVVHFIGLLSDGNVHSHIDHLIAMLRRCSEEGVQRARVHVLLDGRDVQETSALRYLTTLEDLLTELSSRPDRDYRVASGGGRMTTTMDRYGADWSMVERGWQVHVRGEGRGFGSAREAVETFRAEQPGIIDQNLPSFVVVDSEGRPLGPVESGDSVVGFNFRGDRAIELSRVFDDAEFTEFERGARPDVFYAGMMQYDGDLSIPAHYLVSPPLIDRTLGEYLAQNRLSQLAISETQKFGHVTYFWNGNRSGMFAPEYEHYIEIPSDRISFDQKPQMKARQIGDTFIARLKQGDVRHARLNFANGDMVGHTGNLEASILAVEAVDAQVARLLAVIESLQGALIVTADHGNADQMFEHTDGGGRTPKTSHTLNRVPFYIHAPAAELRLGRDIQHPTLSNVAATVLQLMGYSPPVDFEPGLLVF